MFTSPEKSAVRSARALSGALLAAAALALSLAAPSAGAQGASGSSTDRATGSMGSGSAAGAPSVMSGTGAAISREDITLTSDLAQINISEIDSGRMALDKSHNPEVRKFAQQMVDAHTTALDDLKTLAQTKGFTLPNETDFQHKTLATALKMLSGDTFDSQYIKRIGVGDHERTLALLQKIQKRAKDADLKTLAAKTLPSVQAHLLMAKQMNTTAGAGKTDVH
jgi:putative membrane protein